MNCIQECEGKHSRRAKSPVTGNTLRVATMRELVNQFRIGQSVEEASGAITSERASGARSGDWSW